MTDLIATNALLDKIHKCQDLAEAVDFIKQIDALKVALESVKQFRENAIRYARLEAEALIRVVSLGGLDQLRGYHRKAAKWLVELSDADKEKYISMCEEGLTIDQVWRREIGENEKLSEKINEANVYRKWAIEEIQEAGIVDLTEYQNSVKKALAAFPDVARDMIDGTRRELRKIGAVGIGGNSCVYVMENSGFTEEIKKAIKLRFESIIDDFTSIKEICETSEIKLSYKDLYDGNFLGIGRPCNAYLVPLLTALGHMGIFTDSQELVENIAKESIYEEVMLAKDFGVARDKYIEIQYQKIQNRKEA